MRGHVVSPRKSHVTSMRMRLFKLKSYLAHNDDASAGVEGVTDRQSPTGGSKGELN